jgi:hypothetical protein
VLEGKASEKVEEIKNTRTDNKHRHMALCVTAGYGKTLALYLRGPVISKHVHGPLSWPKAGLRY